MAEENRDKGKKEKKKKSQRREEGEKMFYGRGKIEKKEEDRKK